MAIPISTSPEAELADNLAVLQSELARLAAAADTGWADPAWRREVAEWRQRAAAAIATEVQSRKSAADFAAAEALLNRLHDLGANDFPSDAETVGNAHAMAQQGTAGMIGATFLVPNWQATFVPRLRDMPVWLTPYLATYQFLVPKVITTEDQPERCARAHLHALDSLVGLAEANRAAGVVREVLERYRVAEENPVITLARPVHAQIRERRGRLIHALGRMGSFTEPVAFPREGRPLRIGIVSNALNSTDGAMTLLGMLERLSVFRFSVTLFVNTRSDSPVERQLLNRGAVLTELANDAETGANTLRDAALDVAVFLPSGSWLQNPIIEMAQRRAAPVQILYDDTGLGSGLPPIDAFLAPLDAAAQSGEKPVLCGPAGVTALNELQPAEPLEVWTKSTVGVDDAALVYGCFADLRLVTSELEQAWADVLSQVSGARVIIAARPAAGYPVSRFCAHLSSVLESRGVESSRVSVFNDVSIVSHDERKACLGAVDVLLDATIPQSSDWVCAALACAKPMVVWSRPGHSAPMLLKAAGAGACVANSRDEYTAIAVRLGNEESFRQHVIRNMTQSAPEVLARCDSFAMSDAFGRLLETAFDRVIQSRRVWRNEVSLLRLEEPLDVTAALEEAAMFMDIGSAADAEVRLRSLLQSGSKGDIVRRRLAAALTHQGQHAEAADLLISAVDLVPADASVWVELGQAARQAGRVQLAIQALQTAVKIDPKRVATWQTLAEIARDVGNEELLADINSILGQLEPPPTDASVPSLTADLADSAAR